MRFHAGLLSGQRFRGSDLVANGRVCFVDNVVDSVIYFRQLRPKASQDVHVVAGWFFRPLVENYLSASVDQLFETQYFV